MGTGAVPEWEWLLRILLAAVLGGLVGLERERHGREAGLRTMFLVGMGTALIMTTSLRIVDLFPGAGHIQVDPARIASGVVTGIGFLGAGAIVKDARRIRGLTTAACLWLVTAVGLAAGCGFMDLAIAATAAALLALHLLKKMELMFPRDIYARISVSGTGDGTFADRVRGAVAATGARILATELERDRTAGTASLVVSVRYSDPAAGERALAEILEIPGVTKASVK